MATLIKTGKIKPRSKIVVFAYSSAAYLLGLVSYVTSEACKEKFLRHAPKGEIATQIRADRHHDKLVEEKRAHDDEKITITTTDNREIVVHLTEKERKILEVCENDPRNRQRIMVANNLFSLSCRNAGRRPFITTAFPWPF